MPVISACIHRCTIERATHTMDTYGQRVSTYAPVAQNVPCRLVQDEVRAQVSVLAEQPVTTITTLIVLPSSGLTEGDRISNVIDETGAQQPGVYEVRTLVARRRGRHGIGHISATIERVAATGGVL